MSYSTGSVAAATTSAEMKTALDLATDNQGNLVTTVGAFSVDSNVLKFTYTRAGNVDNTNSISATHSEL